MSDTIEKLQLRVRDLEQCEVDLSVFREEVSRMSRASETYQRNLRSAEEKISSLEKRLDSYFDIEEREHQALLRIQSLEDELRHRDSDLFAQESKVAEVEKSLVSETRDHSTDRLRLFDLDRELRDVKRYRFFLNQIDVNHDSLFVTTHFVVHEISSCAEYLTVLCS